MKIFYSTGDFSDSGRQLARFLKNSGHQVVTAAYFKAGQFLPHITWTLDALYNRLESKDSKDIFQLLGHAGTPRVCLKNTEILLRELDEFGPDLIISNGEPVSAHLAQALSVKLWYCSPLFLLPGVKWNYGDIMYYGLLVAMQALLTRLPPADKILVYSPFGDLIHPPSLRAGYEWVQPYWIKAEEVSDNKNLVVIGDQTRAKRLTSLFRYLDFETQVVSCPNDASYGKSLSGLEWTFNTGETSLIADAIYNMVPRLCIAPSLNQPENFLNAIMCRAAGIGPNLGQVELMDRFAIGEIEKVYRGSTSKKYIERASMPMLHEKLQELEEKGSL